MRSVVHLLAALCLAALAACGGSGSPGHGTDESAVDGTGFLVVNDLRVPPMEGHFTGLARRMEARVSLRPNGCVAVVIDGVERMPLWPDGTSVVDSVDRPGHYTVTLTTGLLLLVSEGDGEAFEAVGVIDDNPAPFSPDPTTPGKIDSLLGLCGVVDLPVAFNDASTFEKH